jgi:carboxyl-terminal processing protease
MKILFIKLLIVSVLVCTASFGYAQTDKKRASEKAALLIQHLSNLHYSPPPIDDKFSKSLFTDFINNLDSRRLYFTREDLESFRAYQYKLDNELKGESWTFLPMIIDTYKKRLIGSEKIFTEILQNPLSYKESQTYQNPDEDTLLFYSLEDQVSNWKRWLSYQQLHLFFSNYAGKNPDSLKSTPELLKNEAEVRLKILNLEKRYIQHILNNASGYEEGITTLFLNTVAEQYDPHTNYFSKTQFEQFKSMLSAEEYSFGIEIAADETGNIIVSKLIPGGPAWKSNEVHKGDIITELKWVGKNAIDISGADPKEVLYIFNGSNSEKLEFSLKKATGLSTKVILKKERIDNEENSVKGYILNGSKKIGYISLPGFYTEWENRDGNGCANDVAKEIIKLKESNIEALILDLRNNGGGSTYETLNLLGIFIDEGPLFLKNNKDGKPILMKDINRGTIYDDPLLVMINGYSASASEIVASTLQDYHRAFIVGSTSFGKATEQGMVAVHSGEPLYDYSILDSPDYFGITKVTECKLYRITTNSNQLKGVVPDFIFPEIKSNYEYKETKFRNPLPNDNIKKLLYYSTFDTLPLTILRKKSEDRINQSLQFDKIELLNQDIPESWRKSKTIVPLNLEYFRTRYLKSYRWQKTLAELDTVKSNDYKVKQHKYDKILYEKKVGDAELIQKTMENIEKDYYIQESFWILTDYLILKKQ